MNTKPKQLHADAQAQAMSYDLMIAGVIFVLLIAVAYTFYSNMQNSLLEQDSLQTMHLAAVNTCTTILSDQNCTAGGIVNEKGILSSTKIACVSALDYNAMKTSLGIEAYELSLTVSDGNNALLQKGTTTTNRAVAVQRSALLGVKPIKITCVLYEK